MREGNLVEVGGEPIPGGPSTPTRYRVSADYRVMIWFGVALLWVLVLFCFVLPFIFPGDFDLLYVGFAGTLAFGALGLHMLSRALASRAEFQIDDQGITRVAPDGRAETLAWREIAGVRERPLLQRLELIDRAGRSAMELGYRVDGFDELVGTVGHRVHAERRSPSAPAPGASPATSRARTFSRAWGPKIALPAVAVLAVAGSIHFFGGVLIVAGVVSIIALAIWLRGWWRIDIGPDHVVVKYPLRSFRFATAEIGGLALESTSNDSHASIAVIVGLKDGTNLRLGGCREGTLPLYAAFHQAWGSPASGEAE